MPSLNDRFLPMFKNMRFEMIVQICHVTQPVFMTLFPGFGIKIVQSRDNMSYDVVFLKPRAGFRGGLEKYTDRLSRAFAEKGLSVALLTTGTPPAIEGVNVISLAPDSKFTWRQIKRFDALCKSWLRHNPSPIVFGMERTSFQTHYRAGNGVHAVYLQRRQLIDPFWKTSTFSLNPLHRSLLKIEKEAFESPSLKKLFTNSKMVRDEILSLYHTPQEKIEVVHNGVEWKRWETDFESSLQNQQAGPHRFLFVGNGYMRKGLPFLLEGLRRIRHENFHLTVIGKDKNLPRYVAMASSLGIKEKIDFLGPQSDLRPFYSAADTLMIPSIYDPFANVTLEALAMGLFVVSSMFNGAVEILKNGSGTVLEDLASASCMENALRLALAKPKTRERALQIRESVKELDFSSQLDKIVRLTIG